MFGLTSPALFWTTTLLAVVLPAGLAAAWLRSRRVTRPPSDARVLRVLPRPVVRVTAVVTTVLAAQALAVTAVLLRVNDDYGFYASWSDLLGADAGATTLAGAGLHETLGTASDPALAADAGRTTEVTVSGGPSHATGRLLVWLPPQYDDPRYRDTRFPVVLFLPGQPSTPEHTFSMFALGSAATQAIAAGTTKPFVAVVAPLMTNPPRDTECTDIPGGPAAETWLASDVTRAVAHDFRTVPVGPRWSVMGWSTGGFCAAKLLLNRPAQFGAAVSIGGYFSPLTDSTTGDLFHHDVAVEDENSPSWLYRHHGLHGRDLLIVAATQDEGSYVSSAAMIRAASSDRHVDSIVIPQGGHNFQLYRTYLGDAFAWLSHAVGA